jgi:copper(I)-binding protein
MGQRSQGSRRDRRRPSALRRISIRWGVIVALVVAGCSVGAQSTPRVVDAVIGQPTGPNAALYFRAVSTGESDRLKGAITAVASVIEMHETTMNNDGTMTMQPVASLPLPAGGELVLEPGGLHFMLVDVDRLEIDQLVEVLLSWEIAGEVAMEAKVVSPADVIGDR